MEGDLVAVDYYEGPASGRPLQEVPRPDRVREEGCDNMPDFASVENKEGGRNGFRGSGYTLLARFQAQI